ncbi:UDP-glucose 4-epimerase [Sarocladium strictum]
MSRSIFSRSASEYSLGGASQVESPDTSYLDGPFDNLSLASTPDTEHSDAFDHVRILAPGQNTNEYILVVGGLGYIGSHTSWELLKDGYNVIVIDNLSNSFTTVLDTLHSMNNERHSESSSSAKTRRPELHFHEADFRDQGKMETILREYNYGSTSDSMSKIKGVIHFAAYKSVSESISDPLKYYDNNVAGLVSFCRTLSGFNIKNLVFSSSATVYGVLADKGGRLPEEFCTHKETNWSDSRGQLQTTLAGCTGLTNPYGRTKWMCEAILADLAVSDPDWTVVALRYFNPVGCDDSGRLGEDPRMAPTNLMPVVLQVLTGGRDHLDVYGTDWDTPDGTAIRDFIHVSDLARGHLAALSTRMTGFQTFNIGTGSGHSVTEVVDAMEQASGKRIASIKTGRRDGDVGMCVADPTRAMTELGWKPYKTLLDSCLDLCRFLGIETAASRVS